MSSKSRYLRIFSIIGILVVVLALFAFLLPSLIRHRALEHFVNANNKILPSLTSDGSVRTDSCELGSNRIIHFHVTVLNYNAATSRSPDDFQNYFKANVVQMIKTGVLNDEFVFYFGGSLEYDFYEANGKSITSALITADDFDFPWHKKP